MESMGEVCCCPPAMIRGRVAFCFCVLLGSLLTLNACDERELAAPRKGSDDRRAPLAAVRAWVDPDTGRLAAPSAAEDEPFVRRDGAAAASQPLVLVPGKTAAGGKMVDLRGRFTYSRRATVSPDGGMTMACDLGDEAGGRE